MKWWIRCAQFICTQGLGACHLKGFLMLAGEAAVLNAPCALPLWLRYYREPILSPQKLYKATLSHQRAVYIQLGYATVWSKPALA